MEKLLYQIALTQINGVGDIIARNLLDIIGDEEAIFKSSKKDLLSIRGISRKLVDEILDPEVIKRAEKELLFVEKNNIQTFFISGEEYPARLKECTDAPVMLYYKGNAGLNASKIISIVGTRNSTSYGNGFCADFIQELTLHFQDVLIVSGLAYGIDIHAHKAALKHSLPTIGVLAHGLDRIYPSLHRKYAVQMIENGGLLTEFPSNTEPDKHNFIRRNRIVAGLADAVIIAESGIKGGAMVTSEIANSYNKDVFAVPGRINDQSSAGCNKLIAGNKAVLIQSVGDFLAAMNWDNNAKKTVPKQHKLLLDLTDEEQRVYDALKLSDTMHVNLLSIEVGIPVSQLFFTLLEMEMKNIIKPLPGGLYRLI